MKIPDRATGVLAIQLIFWLAISIGDDMSNKKKKCYHCQHSGTMFKIHSGTHCHCEHPDTKISGEPGWDSLRFAFDTCKAFEPKIIVG